MSVVEPDGTLDPADPASFVIRLGLDDYDGDVCKHFKVGGPVEIWLVGTRQPRDAAGHDDLKTLTLALQFPNFPTARLRGNGIAQALGQLERAIERAQADAHQEIPTRNDGHLHVVKFGRYARVLPTVAFCEICMEELVDDVAGWALARGLAEGRNPTLVGGRPHIDIAIHGDTVRDAIEKAFNQDGGSDG